LFYSIPNFGVPIAQLMQQACLWGTRRHVYRHAVDLFRNDGWIVEIAPLSLPLV
jgi:hypothetical protein